MRIDMLIQANTEGLSDDLASPRQGRDTGPRQTFPPFHNANPQTPGPCLVALIEIGVKQMKTEIICGVIVIGAFFGFLALAGYAVTHITL